MTMKAQKEDPYQYNKGNKLDLHRRKRTYNVEDEDIQE